MTKDKNNNKNSIVENTNFKDTPSEAEVKESQDLPTENKALESSITETEEAAREAASDKNNKTILIYKSLRILFTAGFFLFTALFLNEIWLQPFLAQKANSKAQNLYVMPEPTPVTEEDTEPTVIPTDIKIKEEATVPTPTPDPTRDEQGRLLEFRDLLNINHDVKGWIKIDHLNGENDTKINYVVVQSSNGDPDYYLTRDWEGNKVKAGSLYLDYKSSVENNTQNLVIHGHNMTSTDDMFHYLLKYNEKEYYDTHPIIDFNTIYETGQWKIFSVFITNGSSEKEPFFNYTKSEFMNSSDFLNFVYQTRIRSFFNADDIDINENDQLLTLSTCSYEVEDYRTVIVARRVREGEEATVDTNNVFINPKPLYPGSYYYRYGGKAPKLPETFEEALEAGLINWYMPTVEP